MSHRYSFLVRGNSSLNDVARGLIRDPKFDFLSPVAPIYIFVPLFSVVDFLFMSRRQEINTK